MPNTTAFKWTLKAATLYSKNHLHSCFTTTKPHNNMFRTIITTINITSTYRENTKNFFTKIYKHTYIPAIQEPAPWTN